MLLVEGAPGFEHSFLKRAWAGDRGLEIDSVVRKGRDDSGADTFYVQAARSRADALTAGYPRTRDALFAYDVIVLANVDVAELKGVDLDLTRAFVGERGGGLLVLGARGFQHHGLRDTPLEPVVPLELADRTGAVVQAGISPGVNRVALTPAGEEHPVMQLAPTPDENVKRWAAVPPLASISALGGPTAWRRGPRRHRRARRRAARARGGAALRAGTLDDLHRRGRVALADDAADDRSVLRSLLASGRALARSGHSGPRRGDAAHCPGDRRSVDDDGGRA